MFIVNRVEDKNNTGVIAEILWSYNINSNRDGEIKFNIYILLVYQLIFNGV